MRDLTTDFGAIVFQNEFCVVRVKTIALPNPGSPQIQVVVHRKDDQGNERLPHGYWLGSNMLRLSSGH